ncbi:MAG: hypothetical protein ACR2QE_10415 [Acidimicrobiales bacterium]
MKTRTRVLTGVLVALLAPLGVTTAVAAQENSGDERAKTYEMTFDQFDEECGWEDDSGVEFEEFDDLLDVTCTSGGEPVFTCTTLAGSETLSCQNSHQISAPSGAQSWNAGSVGAVEGGSASATTHGTGTTSTATR